jgi:hypothetical protein
MSFDPREDESLLGLLASFDYEALPGPPYADWESAVRQLRERISGGQNRDLAKRVVPLMVVALEATDPARSQYVDVREEAIRTLGEAPEMLDDHAKALLRSAVLQDDFYEVASIAAAVLDDTDPHEGDEAWQAYVSRSDAPRAYREQPKPT